MNEVIKALNASATTKATATSTTLPRMMKFLNPLSTSNPLGRDSYQRAPVPPACCLVDLPRDVLAWMDRIMSVRGGAGKDIKAGRAPANCGLHLGRRVWAGPPRPGGPAHSG